MVSKENMASAKKLSFLLFLVCFVFGRSIAEEVVIIEEEGDTFGPAAPGPATTSLIDSFMAMIENFAAGPASGPAAGPEDSSGMIVGLQDDSGMAAAPNQADDSGAAPDGDNDSGTADGASSSKSGGSADYR